MDVIKEIKATDSYLGLNQVSVGQRLYIFKFLQLHQIVTECQNIESYYNCTTRKYYNTFIEKCGCVPFNIRTSDKVFLLL